MKRQSMSGLQLAYMATKTTGIKRQNTGGDGATCFYVFNIGNNEGFIIISGDDIAIPVLGYSNEGSFSTDGQSPEFSHWLGNIRDEISSALDNGVGQDEETAGQWEAYLSEGGLVRQAVSVSPLLTTKWGQKSPYNDQCPLIGKERALSGCVATAMAQIMKYYGDKGKGPLTGKGSYGGIDFSKTTYTWSDMKDDYSGSVTQKQKEAVATLMYHAGVSVDMEYGVDWSGALPVNVPKAFSAYFGYDKNFRYKAYFLHNEKDWIDVIRKELDGKRPVLYSSQDENGGGGHTYVCDGYDSSGKFHINWGWDGRENGYFALSAFNVLDYRFNKNAYIAIGLQPDAGGAETAEIRLTNDLKLDNNNLEVEKAFSMSVRCANVSYTGKVFRGYLGIVLVDRNNDEVIYRLIGQSKSVGMSDIGSGSATIACTVPEVIDKNKSYALRVAVKHPEMNEWEIISGNCIYTLPVNIVTIPVTGVSIPASEQMNVGDMKELIVKTIPVNATNPEFSWKSNNEAVATVDASGTVKARSAGSASITVSSNGKSAVCALKVVDQKVPVKTVTISQTIEDAAIGGSYTLTCTVLPTNAYDRSVTWTSSNNTIAEVNGSGTVRINKAGTVDITAASVDNPNIKDKVTITIKSSISVTGVTLEDLPGTLESGNTYQLRYAVIPANATNQAVTFGCNDASVALVDTKGLLTVKGPGSTYVTVTTDDGKKTAKAFLTVSQKQGVNITGLSFYKVPETLQVGDTYQLLHTVYPYAATNKSVTWSSSNTSVATVNGNGLLTVKAAGTVTITVTSVADLTKKNSQAITIKSTNVNVAVTGLSFYKVPETLQVGDTYQLLHTVYPYAATNKSVTWGSSNTSVATVSSSGLLTVKGTGSTTVTLSSVSDPGKKNSQVITIKPSLVSVTGLSFFKVPETLQVGDTYQLVYSVWPVNASNKSICWESSNTAIMTVSNTGLLTVKSAGTATVTLTSVDGGKKNAQVISAGKSGLMSEFLSDTPEADKITVLAYPNPSNGLFTVGLGETGSCGITVSTLAGKVVIRKVISDTENRIDMTGYPAGIYLLTIDKDGSRRTLRIVIER